MSAGGQVLTCEECGIEWSRAPVRGRKPRRCSQCAPLATELPDRVVEDEVGVLVLCPACRSNNHRFCLKGEPGYQCECGCAS